MKRSTARASASSAAAAFFVTLPRCSILTSPGVEAPGRDGAAVDQGEGAEDAVRRDQHPVRADDFLARGPAEQQRVEGAEQARRRERLGRRAAWRGRPGRRRARRSSDGDRRRARRGRRAAAGPPSGRGRGRRPGRARPGSGAPARPAPRRDRPARLRAEPVADEDEGVLLADHRPAHDEAAQRGAGRAGGSAPGPRSARRRESSRSRSCARVSGPSSASARSIVSTPRSAGPRVTPSCRSRVALEVSSGGVVSACSSG